MLNLADFNPHTFAPAIEALLADPAQHIDAPVPVLLSDLTNTQALSFVDRHVPNKFGWMDYVGALVGAWSGPASAFAGATALAAGKRFQSQAHRNAILRLLPHFTVSRSVATLTDRDKAAVRGMAHLVASQNLETPAWYLFWARMAWWGGKGVVAIDPPFVAHAHATEARQVVGDALRATQPDYEAFLGDAVRTIAQNPTPNIQAQLARGARWLTPDDLRSSMVLSGHDAAHHLLLGTFEDTAQPVYFPGNESLITIGGPGTGKSQAHVIANLLRSPGSAIVLDVQGELWRQTAGYRQKHFGPVYRFSPTAKDRRSHRYNPFATVSSDPDTAANQCEVFSYQVIADDPTTRDKYWNNRARDFMWACALAMVLTAPPAKRTMANLAALMALPFPSLKDPTDPVFTNSPSGQLLDTFRLLAKNRNIPDLENNADIITVAQMDGGKRLESVLDTARQFTSRFGRASGLRSAMAHSDWNPLDLRKRPGTTVYLCVPFDELEALAPFLRLIFFSHMTVLVNHLAKPGDPPITFYLDEMPQLGYFRSILQMQDLGRKAGLRLWMFAQSMGQLLQAYDTHRAVGMIEACRCAMFMQPDQEARRLLSGLLGETENLFTGEKRPLASPNELVNRTYGDRIIVHTRGEMPATLQKFMAHEHLADRVLAPPVVPLLPPTT